MLNLTGMSDPSSVEQEPPPPPQPPRPVPNTRSTGPRDQVESDALYARQLSEHYNQTAQRQGQLDSSRDYRGQDPRMPRQTREAGLKPNELYDDRERSFIDGG